MSRPGKVPVRYHPDKVTALNKGEESSWPLCPLPCAGAGGILLTATGKRTLGFSGQRQRSSLQ